MKQNIPVYCGLAILVAVFIYLTLKILLILWIDRRLESSTLNDRIDRARMMNSWLDSFFGLVLLFFSLVEYIKNKRYNFLIRLIPEALFFEVRSKNNFAGDVDMKRMVAFFNHVQQTWRLPKNPALPEWRFLRAGILAEWTYFFYKENGACYKEAVEKLGKSIPGDPDAEDWFEKNAAFLDGLQILLKDMSDPDLERICQLTHDNYNEVVCERYEHMWDSDPASYTLASIQELQSKLLDGLHKTQVSNFLKEKKEKPERKQFSIIAA